MNIIKSALVQASYICTVPDRIDTWLLRTSTAINKNEHAKYVMGINLLFHM